ncbi:hypothetical protein DIPPA_26668 [Diplonema papillatum]|nr:hypothetical protein DIPPA_26668 [Diplonema papillatum]
MTREVSESILDLLVTEAAHSFLRQKGNNNHEEIFQNLEAIGFRVGAGMMERLMRDKPLMHLQGSSSSQQKPQGPTDAIKLICRDFWPLAFRKQIDGLRMNNQGIYILNDKSFKWLRHVTHTREEMYYPGIRAVLNKETQLGSHKYPPGTQMVILKQGAAVGKPASTVEADVDGTTYTIDVTSIDVDSPPRINPKLLMYLPAGMLQGALYAIDVIATVKGQLSDKGVSFTTSTKVRQKVSTDTPGDL